MLVAEGTVWIVLEDETLEKGPIEIVAFALLDCKSIVVDFGPQLSVGCRFREKKLSLQRLTCGHQSGLFEMFPVPRQSIRGSPKSPQLLPRGASQG